MGMRNRWMYETSVNQEDKFKYWAYKWLTHQVLLHEHDTLKLNGTRE